MARRKRYSAEFKRQALKRADEPGASDALVCEELGVSTRQLRRWREAVREHGEEEAFPGQGKATFLCRSLRWPFLLFRTAEYRAEL